MRLEDALFNWLQINIVANARPSDNAAKETSDFFYAILEEDHLVKVISVEAIGVNEDMMQIVYEHDGEELKKTFDRELAEQLLRDINENPKYNE